MYQGIDNLFMEKIKLFEKNRPVFAIGSLYTVTALIVVLSAWAEDLHRFGLELTISQYVALRQWTAVLYMIVAVAMTVIAFIHLKRSGMGTFKKLLYSLAFVCVSGCAVCPCNREWSVLMFDLHNYFAYGLMLMVTISFVWMLIKPANRAQRVFGIVAVAYAALFIYFYVITEWEFFINTIFLWENTFIYLLLAELINEYKESRALCVTSKVFPVAGIAGMILSWIVYLAAPRDGQSINDHGQSFWDVMDVAEIICMISFIVFVLGFVTYMLYRPLSAKGKVYKVLDVALRIFLTPAIVVIALFNVYISIFTFAGAWL